MGPRYSEAGTWLRHVKNCGDRWAFLYIDCKLHQVPNNDFYKYGTEIARTISDAGVDPKKCMFSIPDESGYPDPPGGEGQWVRGIVFCHRRDRQQSARSCETRRTGRQRRPNTICR